jgi:hypothetical protein
VLACVYLIRGEIRAFLAYGWSDWPNHESSENCPWVKRVFAKASITAFIANCTDERASDPTTGYAMVFSDADRKIIGKWATNPDYEFTIELLTKDASRDPLDVVKEWYVAPDGDALEH